MKTRAGCRLLRLLSCTALAGLSMHVGPAQAACSNYAPASSTSVLCTGVDNTPIAAGGSNSVTVTLDAAATLSTPGTAITLGNNSIILLSPGAQIIAGAGPAITANTGSTVSIGAGASVTGDINLFGATGNIVTEGSMGSATLGTAAGLSAFYLVDTGTVSGTVTAAAAGTTSFYLFGTGSGTFNTNRIGTDFLNFDSLRKSDSGTWTLTGTNAQTWNISDGTLSVNTASVGNAVLSGPGELLFDQAGSGTYSSVISGSGVVRKTGAGNVTFSGANTFTGPVIVEDGTLCVASNGNLGNAANLVFMNGGTLSMTTGFTTGRTFLLGAGDQIIDTNGFSPTISGAITGTGRLVKANSGILTLSNAGNNYTGGTLIEGAGSIINITSDGNLGDASGAVELSTGGALSVAGSMSTNRNFVMSNGYGNIYMNAGIYTINGVISGNGGLSKAGTGGLTLTGANTYMGGTILNDSILRISADNNLGDASGNVDMWDSSIILGASFNTARDFNLDGTYGEIDTGVFNSTFSGDISGTATLYKTGAGTLTLTGANTRTGGFDVSAGTLVGTTANLTGGNIANSGTLRFDQAANGTFSNIISGTGAVQVQGGGDVTFSNANTYTGGTSISGAGTTLIIGADNNLGGAGGVSLDNGGEINVTSSLTTNRNFNIGAGGGTISTNGIYQMAGALSGSGLLTIGGGGEVNLTGTSTKTGGFYVSSGTLRGNTNNITGDIVNDGSVLFQQPASGTYAGNMSGIGSLIAAGNSLTLTGTNTHTGGTSVIGGTARITASSDANLGGAASILALGFGGVFRYDAGFDMARDVFISTGGTIDTQAFNASISGDLSGNGAITKNGAGTLTLTGASTKTGGFTVSAGTLVGNTGNLTGNISNAGVLRFDQAGSGTYTSAISGAGVVQVQGGGTVTMQNAQTYTGGLTVSGTGSRVIASANDRLGDATGTITLANGGAVQLDFVGTTNRSFILSGGDGIIDPSGNTTINSTVSGNGRLVIAGAGQATINSISTYMGGTVIDTSRVLILSNSALGDLAGNVTIRNGGTLSFQSNLNSARNFTLDTGLQTIENLFVNNTLSGVMSGAGGLYVRGGGSVLTLSGANTYQGGTTIDGNGFNGILAVSADNNLGDANGGINFIAGGILRLDSAFDTTRDVNVAATGGNINTQGFNSTFSGDLSGSGVLTKSGAGTLVLTGSSTKTGGFAVSSGTLIGNTGNLTGNIVNSGIVRFNQSSNGTYSSVLSGGGAVEIQGGGDVTFSGVNTYTGGTSITGAGTTLLISADNNLGGAGSIILDNGGELNTANIFTSNRNVSVGAGGGVISTSGIYTINGDLLGNGLLTKSGTGSVVLTGNSTKTGGFNITAGNLTGTTGNITGDVANAGSLTFTQGTNGTYAGNVSGSGLVSVTGTTGTITLSGTNTHTGGTAVDNFGAILAASSDSNLGAAASDLSLAFFGAFQYGAGFDMARDVNFNSGGIINTQGFSGSISGNLSGTGLLVKSGAGTLTLTGTSTKTGGFDVSAGTLVGDTGNLTGNISNGGTLTFDQGTAGTYGGVISGAGNFVKEGTGNLILSGINTYTGTTTVNDGRLAVNGSATGSDFIVAAGGNIGGSGTIGDLDLSGILSPGNSIGTLHAGNTVFNTGSFYEVEIDDLLNSDLLDITGTLDIDPNVTVSIQAAGGTYSNGSIYTIITHTGLRTGTFDNITSNLAFLTPTLIYNANDVQIQLSLAAGTSFASVADDHVQQEVANAIEDMGGGTSLYDAFVGLTVNDARQALDDLSSEHIPGIPLAMTESSSLIRRTLGSRMQALAHFEPGPEAAALAPLTGSDEFIYANYSAPFLAPQAGDESSLSKADRRMWMRAFGTTGHSIGRATSSQQDRGSAGALAGIDTQLGNRTYLGMYAGYEHGEINTYDERAFSAVDTYHGGLYMTHEIEDGLRFSGGLGGAFSNVDNKRYVVFPGISEAPESETTGYMVNGFIEASQPFYFKNETALEPFLGLSINYAHMNGYEEDNAAVTGLTVRDTMATTLSHTMGLRMGKTYTTEDYDRVHLSGMVGWSHSYGDLESETTMRFTSGASDFTAYAPSRARDSLMLEGGVDTRIGKNANLHFGYTGTLSKDSQDHAISATIKYSF